MKRTEAKNIGQIINLCSSAVNRMTPEQERVSALNLDLLYEAAKKHMLVSMVGQILQRVGVFHSVGIGA